MNGPRLAAVRIATADVDAAGALLALVCGTRAERVDGLLQVGVGDARLILEQSLNGGREGVVAVELDGMQNAHDATMLSNIELRTVAGRQPLEPVDADVVLDHVAIMVNDLSASAAAWEQATGLAAEMIGVHPISNGTLEAARFAVGERMLELISPVAGTTSAVGSRLAKVGEGALALALPAADLDAKRNELEQVGVRLVHQPPHWHVHPANPAGVLIQLTPRVQHH